MPFNNSLRQSIRTLKSAYPWTSTPLMIGAPMRLLAGPKLAVTISEAGGLGFIGPGANPEDLEKELEKAKELVLKSSQLSPFVTSSSASSDEQVLPIGFGIQTWTGDLKTTSSILQRFSSTHVPPAAVWLFAPRHGPSELQEWTQTLKASSPRTKIWIQVASVGDAEAVASNSDPPDVLVIQGSDAGGHSRTQGAGIISLFPEVSDALHRIGGQASSIPLVAAGGIADSRGIAAVLALGASAAAMGTRFLVTPEANINPGYRQAVLDGKDGGQTTVRTQLYNHLRGTMSWPKEFDARGLINASWRDHLAGVPFQENKQKHEEAMKLGDKAWGEKDGRTATYAGTAIGLIHEVEGAADIVRNTRDAVRANLQGALGVLED